MPARDDRDPLHALVEHEAGDLGDVEDLTADQTDIVRINGERGVYMRVLKQPGANTIQVVDAVQKGRSGGASRCCSPIKYS